VLVLGLPDFERLVDQIIIVFRRWGSPTESSLQSRLITPTKSGAYLTAILW